MPFLRNIRPRTARRGVTLIEMLVTVGLLVLMMSVIVQVFTAATSAVSASRTYQELDSSLRQLDATIRTDLGNVTARMTPPLNPKDNLGYFEYGENSFADAQGEDTDDYIRFTVKAPEGQQFTGRFFAVDSTVSSMAAPVQKNYLNTQPITITSQYAEVIYFLRNGNLYRRVLLVAPERQNSTTFNSASFSDLVVAGALAGYHPGVFNSQFIAGLGPAVATSWQGVHDLSAHPAASGSGSTTRIVLNTLGDLTNRENRWAYQRFSNDFFDPSGNYAPDGLSDDQNGDSIPDFWPSLYWNARAAGLTNEANPSGVNLQGNLKNAADQMPFPYVYPGMYTVPHKASMGVGWIYSPDPSNPLATIAQLNQLNHAPVEAGDSLPAPTSTSTWLGFPTWKETMSFGWKDPFWMPSADGAQANGLRYYDPSILPTSNTAVATLNMLPIMPDTVTYLPGTTVPIRNRPLLFSDNVGGTSFISAPLWRQCWEDDLILTGVRSFDVKAYDNSVASYVDLGWGDDGRQFPAGTWTAPPFIGPAAGGAVVNQVFAWPPSSTNLFDLYTQTFAHEGRIPPLTWDNRPDYQNPGLLTNIGDDSSQVVRLRRVWDTWSTDYSYAPATGFNSATGMPWGAAVGAQPVYPSYPPPYPMPLRGLQIQVRVVDPRNERIKVLTIRQDFSDRL